MTGMIWNRGGMDVIDLSRVNDVDEGDLDGNCDVGVDDLSLAILNWG